MRFVISDKATTNPTFILRLPLIYFLNKFFDHELIQIPSEISFLISIKMRKKALDLDSSQLYVQIGISIEF